MLDVSDGIDGLAGIGGRNGIGGMYGLGGLDGLNSIDGIDDIQYGVRLARKAKFDQPRVLNSLSAKDFLSWAKASRESKS